MTWHADIENQRFGQRLNIALARRHDDIFECVTQISVDTGTDFNHGMAVETIQPGAMPPMLSLPAEAARALHDALSRHFGGTSDTLQLRKDYDAERARVDRLVDVLSAVATERR